MPPISPLSDRLKALGVKVGAHDISPPRTPINNHSIESVAPGRIIDTIQGPAYIVDQHFPAEYQHGFQKLFPFQPLLTLSRWAGYPNLHNLPAEAFAFLDTETSGLSGGTGTYAFLVGVGRAEADTFHLAQFFMRSPEEEGALLLAVESFLAPCQVMVTFNGKAFDAPLLNTRYTMQGWRSPLPDMVHIDLLHLARRLYRDRLPSRTLGNLEVAILDIQRSEEEVPGWMIPQMYFDYLRTGDARPMRSVIYHNAMDVVSMAGLLSHFGQLLENPVTANLNGPVDHAAIGRLFDDLQEDQMAVHLYQLSLENGLPEHLFWDTLERLSFLHKRRGEYTKAMELWQKAANNGQIYAYVEIAKVYEHVNNDFDQALNWTEKAIEKVNSPELNPIDKSTWIEALQHRHQRLQRKLTRK